MGRSSTPEHNWSGLYETCPTPICAVAVMGRGADSDRGRAVEFDAPNGPISRFAGRVSMAVNTVSRTIRDRLAIS